MSQKNSFNGTSVVLGIITGNINIYIALYECPAAKQVVKDDGYCGMCPIGSQGYLCEVRNLVCF